MPLGVTTGGAGPPDGRCGLLLPLTGHHPGVLIDIVVYRGIDEMDAVGPLEVFRSAGKGGIDLTARLVTRSPEDVVVCSYGLRVLPDAVYRPGEADVLLVAGGGWSTRADVGAWAEVQQGGWLPLLRAAARTTQIIGGVCTGTMLLAHAGVIGTRRAGSHHAAWDDLASTGAAVVKDRVVDDGDLVTSGGVTSGMDLALWIVEREFGRDRADRISDRMEYPRFRPAQ